MSENVKISVDGSKVTIEFDAAGEGTPSSSGKSFVVASTRGVEKVTAMGRELSIGLNVFTKERAVKRVKAA